MTNYEPQWVGHFSSGGGWGGRPGGAGCASEGGGGCGAREWAQGWGEGFLEA